MGMIADGTVKSEESESATGDSVSGAFDFGGGTSLPFEVPDTLEDIPKVPETPKVSFADAKSSDDKRQSMPRNNSKSNRERQTEYKQRIETAKEAAPYVEAALNEYIKSRLDGASIDSATITVAYWAIETSKGQQVVKGSIGEAMAFHGLAGTAGLTGKFIELVESHPVLFGMVYIVGAMGYLELILQKVIKQQEEVARAAASDSVAIPS